MLPVDSWMVDSGGFAHAPVAQPEQWPAAADPATAAAAAAAEAVAEAAAAAAVAEAAAAAEVAAAAAAAAEIAGLGTPFSGTASIGRRFGSTGAAAAREFPLEMRRSLARRRRGFHSGSTCGAAHRVRRPRVAAARAA